MENQAELHLKALKSVKKTQKLKTFLKMKRKVYEVKKIKIFTYF